MTAQWPIDGKFTITSKFGWRTHPLTGIRSHHNGADLYRQLQPTWIEAPLDGKVVDVGFNTAAGNYVVIQHKIRGRFYCTKYMHMKNGSVHVRRRQRVKAGQPIGKMGSTGASTGIHLHWELFKGKTYRWSAVGLHFIDPIPFWKALIAFEKKQEAEAK